MCSGYDFGYFVKLLTGESLPTNEELFFEKLRIWFPTVYDIKFMMRACKVLKGGLQDVADDLGVSDILHYEHGSLNELMCGVGDANRTVLPSWIRFSPHCVNVLQDARVVFQ